MMSINSRFMAAILAVAILTTSQVATVSAGISNMFTPTKIGVFALVAMWIRLSTKGSNYEYHLSDWKEDLRQVMEDYDVFDIELYKQLVRLFDKYMIGRQVSIIDAHYRTKSEDGTTIITLRDKKLKCRPFGLMGLFDGYVIKQLEKVGDIGKHWDTTAHFFDKFDDATADSNTIIVE